MYLNQIFGNFKVPIKVNVLSSKQTTDKTLIGTFFRNTFHISLKFSSYFIVGNYIILITYNY